jgi:hypothetical protein
MRVAAVESEMAQRALPPATESSSERFSHAIDVPTDCMSPDINQAKFEHQLLPSTTVNPHMGFLVLEHLPRG